MGPSTSDDTYLNSYFLAHSCLLTPVARRPVSSPKEKTVTADAAARTEWPALSTAERTRRWGLTQELIERNDLAALLVERDTV
jgi:hypothetical protein